MADADSIGPVSAQLWIYGMFTGLVIHFAEKIAPLNNEQESVITHSPPLL